MNSEKVIEKLDNIQKDFDSILNYVKHQDQYYYNVCDELNKDLDETNIEYMKKLDNKHFENTDKVLLEIYDNNKKQCEFLSNKIKRTDNIINTFNKIIEIKKNKNLDDIQIISEFSKLFEEYITNTKK